jgi:hypothetical protein
MVVDWMKEHETEIIIIIILARWKLYVCSYWVMIRLLEFLIVDVSSRKKYMRTMEKMK